MKRPQFENPRTHARSTVTTPAAAGMMMLLGTGERREGVMLTGSEMRALHRLYAYREEQPGVRPPMPDGPEPTAPPRPYEQDEDEKRKRWEAWRAYRSWQDPRRFLQADADLHTMRDAETDGLRIVAWLAKHMMPGADPLKAVVAIAVEAGWDVDPHDVEWATQDAEPEEDEDAA